MNPWFAKAVVLIASIVTVLIRAPHGKRSRTVKVAKSRKGLLEVSLLTVAWIAFFVPILWIGTPWLAFANFPLYPFPLVTGSVLMTLSLWLFHRSHGDLGTNWSITLEIRESHRFVTEGVYRHVRHPMYSASCCTDSARRWWSRTGSLALLTLRRWCWCLHFVSGPKRSR